jgi:hypothetical protein
MLPKTDAANKMHMQNMFAPVGFAYTRNIYGIANDISSK